MKRLYRSQYDRVIAGVCGGLGAHYGISAWWFRVLFVVLSIAGGLSVPLYMLLWIAVPDARELFSEEEQRLAQPEHRGDTTRLFDASESQAGRGARFAGDGLVLLGVVFVGIGLMLLLRNLGMLAWLRVLAPAGLIVLGIALLIEVLNRRP